MQLGCKIRKLGAIVKGPLAGSISVSKGEECRGAPQRRDAAETL